MEEEGGGRKKTPRRRRDKSGGEESDKEADNNDKSGSPRRRNRRDEEEGERKEGGDDYNLGGDQKVKADLVDTLSVDTIPLEDFHFKIDKDDLPTDSGVITRSEQLQYLRVNMMNPYDGTLIPAEFAKTSSKEVHYIESFSTGAFKAVEIKQEERKRLVDSAGTLDDEDPAAQEEAILALTGRIQSRINSFALLCQGLMTGIALLDAYLIIASKTDEDLIKYYSRVSGDSRRLTYIFSTIGLAACTDQLLSNWSSKSSDPSKSRAVYVIPALSYFIILLLSLLMAPVANVLYQSIIPNSTAWIDTLLKDTKFVADLQTWKIILYVRVTLILVSWMFIVSNVRVDGVAPVSSSEAAKGSDKDTKIMFTGLANLGGANVGKLTLEELQELRNLQQRILAETEHALDIRNKRANGMGATVAS